MVQAGPGDGPWGLQSWRRGRASEADVQLTAQPVDLHESLSELSHRKQEARM